MKMQLSARFTSHFACMGVKTQQGVQDRGLLAFLGGENKQRILTLVLLLRSLAQY